MHNKFSFYILLITSILIMGFSINIKANTPENTSYECLLMYDGDYTRKSACIKEADEGNPISQFLLGSMFMSGDRGVDTDIIMAILYLNTSCNNLYYPACYMRDNINGGTNVRH